MTSTEIAVHQNGHVAERDVVDGWLAMASDVIKLANVIAPTDFVPEVYRDNPPAVAAAILSGRELGIGPMTALRHVQIVKGMPTLSAEYKRARVLAAGHDFDILELNMTRCRVSGRRRGSNKPPFEVTFTMDDAKRAGLVKDRGAWHTRPRRMLFARAGSELCDLLFSDLVNGLATTEVVADGAETDELPEQEAPAAAGTEQPASPGTVRRKPREKPAAKPVHVDKGEQGINLPKEQQTYAGPPLPDEVPDETDYDTPGTVTSDQLTALWATFSKDMQFTRDEKPYAREVCEKITGRKLIGRTTGNMSRNEASVVLDTLKRCGTRDHLVALMATGEIPDVASDEPA